MIDQPSDPILTGLRTHPSRDSLSPTPQTTRRKGNRSVGGTFTQPPDIYRAFPVYADQIGAESSSSNSTHSGIRSPVSLNPKIDILILNKNFDGFIKKYYEDQAPFEGYEKLTKLVLFVFEYISINRRNFINFTTALHPKWTFQTEAILQCLHELYQ